MSPTLPLPPPQYQQQYQQQPQGNQQPPPYYFYPPIHNPFGPRRRPPRALSFVLIARPFSLVIPGVIVILNIWWSISQRVCPNDATVGDTCFWMLWLSLPIATLSFIWAIASNISARRASHHMSHIPPRVQAAVQLLLAIGSSVCFALLIYHLVHFDTWSRSSEGAMAALLAVLMIADWVIFAWTAYEIKLDHRARQLATSQIPI